MKILIAKDALYDSDYQLWYVHVALNDLEDLIFTVWGKTPALAKERARIIVASLSVKQFCEKLN
jgi:hypothetical protein